MSEENFDSPEREDIPQFVYSVITGILTCVLIVGYLAVTAFVAWLVFRYSPSA
jgi:hypothetical protein